MSRKMMFAVVLGSLSGAIVLLQTRTTTAQVVFFGDGVHVRAPFVTVDVGPQSGVSVRAPYAAVDVGGTGPRRFGPPGPPGLLGPPGPFVVQRPIAETAYPTAQELATMDDESLRLTIQSLSNSLNDRLARFNTGDTWQRYFRLPEAIVNESAASPNERLNATAMLLDRFQKIGSQQQYSMISRLPAFAAMEAALSEMLARGDAKTTTAPREELPLPPPSSEKSLINPTK